MCGLQAYKICFFIFIFGIMQQTTIQLDFKCSKKLSDMTPEGNGRFCGDCKKVVTDFYKTNTSNLLIDAEQDACGTFYAHQLTKPFNDWRDTIITFYQKTTLRFKNNKLLKPGFAFLLMVLLVVTGCRPKLSGIYSTKSHKRMKHAQETAQAKK